MLVGVEVLGRAGKREEYLQVEVALGAQLISHCHESIKEKSLMQIPGSADSGLSPGP